MAAKSKCWSYNAGERGRNWVRAYEKAPGGIVMLEYFEPVYDADKRPVIDPATGDPQMRKARKSTGHRDRKRAIKEAEELAERFKQQDRSRPVESLRELVGRYTQEVTPTKGESKQGHDRRAARVLGSPWVVPAETDPQRPVPRVTLHAWMAKAKAAAGVEVRGLGFHGQKRAGVRTAEFRALPDAVKEFITSTNAEMLREVYDEVSLDDAREAVEMLERARRRA